MCVRECAYENVSLDSTVPSQSCQMQLEHCFRTLTFATDTSVVCRSATRTHLRTQLKRLLLFGSCRCLVWITACRKFFSKAALLSHCFDTRRESSSFRGFDLFSSIQWELQHTRIYMNIIISSVHWTLDLSKSRGKRKLKAYSFANNKWHTHTHTHTTHLKHLNYTIYS